VNPSWLPPRVTKPHLQPMKECMCGFWAYTAGIHRMEALGPVVVGMIEGWGRMVIGPKGFRAEKARIVALCFPNRLAEQPPALKDGPLAVPWRWVSQALTHRSAVYDVAAPHLLPLKLQGIVTRLYPDAAVFRSVEAMHNEFPTTDLSALLDSPPPGGEG
jgi:hypothetical protein